MVPPERSEDLPFLEDSLLLGRIDATAECDSKLQPGGSWVTVTEDAFLSTGVLVTQVNGLRPEAETIATIILEEVVGLAGLLLQVPLIQAIFPALHLGGGVRHFDYY